MTNDIDAINQAISQNVTSLVASLLSMAGILVAMFVLDRWLALASLVVVPIMFWFTRFVARYTRKGFRDLQRDLGQLNGVMEEAIKRATSAARFSPQGFGDRGLPRVQRQGLRGWRVRQ